jgi:enoyl-CoA hydratase/carnithine racemase
VIAAACDIRIASETAKIAFLFVRVGLSGADMGASWLLPRIVGHGRATEILMTGDFVDARRALEIGLYNAVVPVERVLDEATTLAERLARGPAEALAVRSARSTPSGRSTSAALTQADVRRSSWSALTSARRT